MKPKHTTGKPDTRYTVTKEHNGRAVPHHVARFCGEHIGSHPRPEHAWALCCDHQRKRLEIHDLAAAIFK
jgi:hypothetical protein